jgi:hypothetical protein
MNDTREAQRTLALVRELDTVEKIDAFFARADGRDRDADRRIRDRG